MDEEELRGLGTALDRIEDAAVAATGKDEDSRIGEVYAAYDLLVARETPLRRTPVTAFATECSGDIDAGDAGPLLGDRPRVLPCATLATRATGTVPAGAISPRRRPDTTWTRSSRTGPDAAGAQAGAYREESHA